MIFFAINFSIRIAQMVDLQKQPSEAFYKKTVLKNFAKFTGKHMCWRLFLGGCRRPGLILDSSVIRQKGESQNECFMKTKHAKFPEERTFLTPWCAYQGGKKCCMLCFLETLVMRFTLLPYYRQIRKSST